nr:uncharacterized protein LOC122269859 [Parasteatoda tepidariorum]
MDDCLSGAPELSEFEKLKSELTQLLQRGGMTLHKWCSNKASSTELKEFSLDRNSDEIMIKTLGMLWNSLTDSFTYKVTTSTDCNYTKRDVLSQIARIYDPLGLLGPVIVKAKIFMQQLWLLQLDWNEALPPDVSKQWENFIKTLPDIESIHVPRCFLEVSARFVVLHGFADASSKAYGAVIYIQGVSNSNEVTTQLLCSKSRVAPTKSMTIPRLELCSCLLLSKLTQKVIAAIRLEIHSVILYSDSTIALAWINSPSNLLKTFVSNRVSQIQQLSKDFQWKHIPSELNPADLISRGLDVKALAASELWFKGPDFSKLNLPDLQSVQISSGSTDKLYIDELKPVSKITLTLINDSKFLDDFLVKGFLTQEEYRNAENVLLKIVQVKYFSSEISALEKRSPVPSTSKLKFLNPFIDPSDGLIRVGGRLAHSNLNFNQKHPVILPAGNKLVKLIFQYYHKRDFHVGPQALLNTVRLKYWPIGGRNAARKVVHECVECFRNKPVVANQIMGDLPAERVTPSSAFLNAGIDLCGPFEIKYKGQRKGTLQKIYVALFICMATKAVHIEFVSDLTSEALIATLKRFFARRGRSSMIFSDNATNFTGASAELKRLYKLMYSSEDVSNMLSSEGIRWKFLPPRAPNFGGLWEAGVKSFKYHFKRVVGSARLTLEEFLTVITQIEGILNSRPLTPLPSDTDEFQVLTPGHFLIGKPINSIPEPNFIDKKDNLLNRWQRVQKLVQTIWRHWQNSYLSHLQQRSKWLLKKQNLCPGMLVLVKDIQLPTYQWPLGRIIRVISGSDGNVRVADIRTAKGNFRRPISKISILPIVDNFELN